MKRALVALVSVVVVAHAAAQVPPPAAPAAAAAVPAPVGAKSWIVARFEQAARKRGEAAVFPF